MKITALVGMACLLAAGLGGCATGARFQGAASPPSGKALVYIFRERRFVGSAGTANIYANNKVIVKIKSGGYFPYVAEPGDLVLSHETAFGPLMVLPAAIDRAADAKGAPALRLNLEPDHVYYVEWKLGGFASGPTMVRRDEAYARPIIDNCSLLEPTQ